eukprot:scaffold4944_cov209-Pinguiococcus_pyrenoidosus.AAC.4
MMSAKVMSAGLLLGVAACLCKRAALPSRPSSPRSALQVGEALVVLAASPGTAPTRSQRACSTHRMASKRRSVAPSLCRGGSKAPGDDVCSSTGDAQAECSVVAGEAMLAPGRRHTSMGGRDVVGESVAGRRGRFSGGEEVCSLMPFKRPTPSKHMKQGNFNEVFVEEEGREKVPSARLRLPG